MNGLKNFFSISEPFRFEWNDLRAFIQVINVILIMTFGLQVSWFGLAIAFFGVCKDLSQRRHINEMIMHLSSVALNVYFFILLYAR